MSNPTLQAALRSFGEQHGMDVFIPPIAWIVCAELNCLGNVPIMR